MKKHFSLGTWVDLTDSHEYRPGDPFPHDGREIDESRLNELSSAENQTGTPLVEAVEIDEPRKKTK